MVGLPWVEQRNTVSAEFSVFAVKPAITNSFFFKNTVLTIGVGVVKLESVCFHLNRCDVTDVENWKLME